METEQLLRIIGEAQCRAVVCGLYGDASQHANGYLLGDPCYIFDTKVYDQFIRQEALREGSMPHRKWVEVAFKGSKVYVSSVGGDGVRMGHCVDSGLLAAIPESLVPPDILALFNDTTQQSERGSGILK